jgi:hypothetical protein
MKFNTTSLYISPPFFVIAHRLLRVRFDVRDNFQRLQQKAHNLNCEAHLK